MTSLRLSPNLMAFFYAVRNLAWIPNVLSTSVIHPLMDQPLSQPGAAALLSLRVPIPHQRWSILLWIHDSQSTVVDAILDDSSLKGISKAELVEVFKRMKICLDGTSRKTVLKRAVGIHGINDVY
mmetsp:Transcript_20274/g.31688  ORF Transcript_20274/g.31688 Transcript_20274/m.31688 type:complete len:125 (-) Transcript_20274:35-409(-)